MRISDWSSDVCSSDLKNDLRKTIFENCVFNGVDFKHSDLRGLCLDGQTFTGVKFHNAALKDATFKSATLKNVSFRSTYALTNSYYRALKTICFDGATMDKLTYAALKGFGADLSTVTTVRSEEHTSELQSLMRNTYAVFCLKKKT